MGMSLTVLDFFNRSIGLTIGSIHGKRLAELGDQKLWAKIRLTESGGRVWAKEWFEDQGCHHYSIDIHGKHGSHPLDLSKPLEDGFWHNNFDIVTNFGTSEHVENQYNCWLNIHNLGRAGSIYIHALPKLCKYNKDHSPYYYSSSFFEYLTESNEYTLVLNEYLARIEHYACCYIKTKNKPFQTTEEQLDKWIRKAEEWPNQ